MLLLIPYFFFVLSLVYCYGIIPFVVFKLKLPQNPFMPFLLGYAVLGILSQWFFIVGPINQFALGLVILAALVAIWRYFSIFKLHLNNVCSWFQMQRSSLLLIITVFCFVVIYQSSLPSKINDMFMYYLQTIQWMQNYGVVKGLANLHPSLGLASSWHSLVSLFGVLGILFETQFYALNGTLLIVLFLYLLAAINQSINEANQKAQNFLVAFMALVFPLGFLYLTAPSPDLPVLVFSPLLLFWFLFKKNNFSKGLLVFISCFVFACKPPAFLSVSLSIIVLLLVFRTNQFVLFRQRLKQIGFYLLIGLFCIGPIIYKNYIQTGYPLFPSSIEMPTIAQQTLAINPQAPWKIPGDWNAAYINGIISWGLSDSTSKATFQKTSLKYNNRMLIWLMRKGYKGFFNKFIFLNFIAAFFLLLLIIRKRKAKLFSEANYIIFLLCFISIAEWLYLSQYRLMLPTALALFAYNVSILANFKFGMPPRQLQFGLPLVLVILLCLMAFVPMQFFAASSRNKQITKGDGFTSEHLFRPYCNYQEGFLDTFYVDQILFHTYRNKGYMYNCPIPSQSIGYRWFVNQNYGYTLHALGNKIENGFYVARDSINFKQP